MDRSNVTFFIAAMGMIFYTGQIQGYFQFLGLVGGILFLWATLHLREKAEKEKSVKSNTTLSKISS